MKSDDPDRQLAAALGRVPSGIFVVTVARDGVATGMLASWVQQCSFQPPRLTLAVQPKRAIVELLPAGAGFTLNILESSQTDIVAHFGKGYALNEDAFHGLSIHQSGDGGPVLTEALAYLDCQVVQRLAAGDHDLFIADIRAGRVLDEGQPMIHIRKNGMHY
ncbi:MAG: flavin reductase family protein [Gemmataceae bacterium]|nr:flavin reductase family protein [Gemmataceae bacterium]